jgi:phospholipid/cholesterol/gamma-HCH transport system substrate-binding protein
MDESKLELKVGALILAAVAGAVALLSLMGELHFSSGHTLTVDFGHTGNVVKGAPVKLAGFVVGRVDKVELLATRRDKAGQPLPVKMTLSVNDEASAALRDDAAVTVSSQGPLGEPYLEVWPGTSDVAHDEKVAVRGLDAPRIDVVSARLASFLESASRVLEKDPDALGRLVSGMGGFARTADDVLKENRGEVRSMAQELLASARWPRRPAPSWSPAAAPMGSSTTPRPWPRGRAPTTPISPRRRRSRWAGWRRCPARSPKKTGSASSR